MNPTLRKPAGIGLILLLIAVWAVAIASVSPWIARLPAIVEAAVYLIAGVAWIAPLGPVLRWMETGRWR